MRNCDSDCGFKHSANSGNTGCTGFPATASLGLTSVDHPLSSYRDQAIKIVFGFPALLSASIRLRWFFYASRTSFLPQSVNRSFRCSVFMVGHSCSPRCRRSHFTESDWEVHKHLTAKLIELLSSDDAVRNWSFETGNQAYISRKKGPFLSQVTKKLFADDPIFGGQYHTRYIQLLELTRSRIYQ